MNLSNENVIQVNKNGISYLQFKKLLEYDHILKHCFTLKPLDFGSNNTFEKNQTKYLKNYNNICKELELEANQILRPYQTHTDTIKKVDKNIAGIFLEDFKDVDGLITNKKDITLSLVYADCIPLYFFDPQKKVIANIHSGWKGTLKQIGKKAAIKMIEEYNCNPKDIICCIGPSIGKCHFEVEEDVAKMFYDTFKQTKRINEIIEKKEKYHIDTVLINRIMLEEVGLLSENIIESKICTVCSNNLIHSYRKEKEEAGRNSSLIVLI